MKSSSHRLCGTRAVSLLLLLTFSTAEARLAMAQQAGERHSQVASPASPGGSQAVAANELPESPLPANPQPADKGLPAAVPEAAAGQSQNNAHKPVGTAAAPYEPTMGIAASRPAGAAIAPAKQHQVRSFLIKLGAIAAAGAAIGTVYALSKGTSSTPPNTTTATASATR